VGKVGWLTRSAEPADYDGMKWTTLGKYVGLARGAEVEAALQGDEAWEVRGAHTKYFLYGAPKNHDHYGLSIFCMDKR
jgi:hypothetical protein